MEQAEGIAKPEIQADKKPLPILPFVAVALTMSLGLTVYRVATGGEPYYNNDEARHIMTSVFWADFLRVMPVRDTAGFVKTYYGHYPAIAPLHWPPLLSMTTGGVFRLFGPSVPLARVLVLLTALVWLAAVFALASEVWGRRAGFVAVGLLAVTKTSMLFGSLFMLEIPCQMWMALSLLAFARYVRSAAARWIWLCAGSAVAAVLTKQHGAIVLPALVAGAITGFERRHWRNRHLHVSSVLAILVAGGYYGFALSHITSSAQDVHAVSGDTGPAVGEALLDLSPALGLGALIGLIGLFFRQRSWLDWSAIAMATGCAGLFFAFGVKDSRYLCYWQAPLALLAAAAISRGIRKLPLAGPAALGAALVASVAFSGSRLPEGRLTGYEEAAVVAAELSEGRPVLFAGVYDGPFILYRRLHDPSLRATTLRGSKLLGGGNIIPERNYEAYVDGRRDILDRLEEWGVRWVVAEHEPEMDRPEHRLFWRMLGEPRFALRDKIRITYPDGSMRYIDVYEFLDAAEKAPDTIHIPMPTLQQDVIRFHPDRSLLEWPHDRGEDRPE